MQTIPFFDDFRKPLYPLDVTWCKWAEPETGDCVITDAWSISIPTGASEQVRIAAQDLHDFLAEAELDLAMTEDEQADGPVIRLRQGDGVDGQPESYSIRVQPDGIAISGADDSGIMYGVFFLEEQLRFRGGPMLRCEEIRRTPALRTRILRSPMSFFHRQELATVLDAYPDRYLLRMAHQGFNGIWLRGRLHQMAKVDGFPEFGEDSDDILKKLNQLVERCRRYGIRVYLFFNEPLGMPRKGEFFENHPQVKGQPHEGEDVYALCTSTPEVQTFLTEGMRYVFSRVSGLAGVILITASEFHTHCFSHLNTRNRSPEEWGADMQCDRCRKRSPQEVIGECVRCIRDGVRAANPDAEIIAWNWSWTLYEDNPQKGVIDALPEGVCVMADFERGGDRVTDGFAHTVDEYSQTYIGPSERFQGAAEVARDSGRPLFTKLQVGVTHEIASVPYFPVYYNLAEKFVRLRREGVTGAMECWNFGNILSPNTEIAHWFSWTPPPESIDSYLNRRAERDFGPDAAPGMVKAWRHFAESTRHYPFSIPLLYWGPQHMGPACPVYFRSVDRHMPLPWLLPAEVTYDTDFAWMSYTEPGDQIENYLGGFSPEKLVSCFDNLIEEWQRGLEVMEEALRQVPSRLQPNAIMEWTVSAAVGSQFRTVRNVTEFTALRNRYWQDPKGPEAGELLERLAEIATNEIDNALVCKALIPDNPMLGFHGEAFGFNYTPAKIDEKVRIVRDQIAEIQAALRHLGSRDR